VDYAIGEHHQDTPGRRWLCQIILFGFGLLFSPFHCFLAFFLAFPLGSLYHYKCRLNNSILGEVMRKVKPKILREIADLRAYCARHKIKPAPVARVMRVSNQYVSAALRGEIPLSPGQIVRLRAAIEHIKKNLSGASDEVNPCK